MRCSTLLARRLARIDGGRDDRVLDNKEVS
jgi:hypothetical protein